MDEIDIAAPADVVYGLIAGATHWPQYFIPNVHVQRTELDASAERLRIWAMANGEIRTWTSHRALDPHNHRVEFHQEVSSPPVASMGGTWSVEPRTSGTSRLELTHHFDAVDDDPDGVEWISKATAKNSAAELANIKELAERRSRLDELVFSFEDSVLVKGDARAAYDFLYEAGEWPRRLPHVARLDLREDPENMQLMSMETRAKDGSTHTTESARICFPHNRIVYKQLVTPALMTAHTGEWVIEPAEAGVLVRALHTVTLNEPAIGPDATVASTRAFIRDAVGGNSRATLALAKEFAEGDRG